VLVQICPREVLLPQSELASIRKARVIVERNRILVTCRPTAEFSQLQAVLWIRSHFLSDSDPQIFFSESNSDSVFGFGSLY
jgi:hypothetical protein